MSNSASISDDDKSKEATRVGWTPRQWFKTDTLLRALVTLLIIIAVFWLAQIVWSLIGTFSSLLALFFASWLLSTLLAPLIKFLVARGQPKGLSIAIAFLVLVGILVIFGVIVLPGLIAQTTSLLNNIGGISSELEKGINGLLKSLNLNINIADLFGQLNQVATEVLRNALGVATGVASALISLLLLIIITFSLLAGRDYGTRTSEKPVKPDTGPFSKLNKLKPPPKKNEQSLQSLWTYLPTSWQHRTRRVRLSFEKNFGKFLGGQMACALIYGFATAIIMWIAGFDYPYTTACICGVLMIIPFFGGPLSLLPPLLVGFSRNDSPILFVMLALFILQTLLLNVVLPKLVGSSSGVGPVTTLFVLLAGAQIAGIFGVLMAVPLIGVLKSLAIEFVSSYVDRDGALPVAPSVTQEVATGKISYQTAPTTSSPIPPAKPAATNPVAFNGSGTGDKVRPAPSLIEIEGEGYGG